MHSNAIPLETHVLELIKERLVSQPLVVPREIPIEAFDSRKVEETLNLEKERALFAIEQLRLKRQNLLRYQSLPELKAIVEAKKKTLLDVESSNSTQSEDQKLQLYRLRKQRGLKVVETGKPSRHTRDHSGSKDRYFDSIVTLHFFSSVNPTHQQKRKYFGSCKPCMLLMM